MATFLSELMKKLKDENIQLAGTKMIAGINLTTDKLSDDTIAFLISV